MVGLWVGGKHVYQYVGDEHAGVEINIKTEMPAKMKSEMMLDFPTKYWIHGGGGRR